MTKMGAVNLGRVADLESISTPLLCLYSSSDDVVSLDQMQTAFDRIRSNANLLVEIETASGHVLAGDILCPQSPLASFASLDDSLGMGRSWQRAKELLSHVYWVGGGAAAGKSSISRRLSNEFGFTLFSGDRRWIEHWQTASAQRNPVAHQIGETTRRGDPFDWFFDRSGKEIADDYRKMGRVEFEDAVDELLQMPRKTPIVVDAFLGLPQLVLEVAEPHRAVFLICTDDFMKMMWNNRVTAGSPDFLPILRKQLDTCSDPQAAVDNFIESNVIQNRFIAEDCQNRCATLTVTGGRMNLDDAYATVKRCFRVDQ